MKHRNAYTLEGGENMQQTRLGRTVRYLAVVLVMVSSLALLACPGNDEETRNVAATVPASASTVAAVQAQPFTITNGEVFTGIPANTPVTLAFGTPTATTAPFTLSRVGTTQTATGNTTFGSCIFTVTASSFPAGQGPQVGATITFPTCNIAVSATGVVVGGGGVSGTATLMLSGPTGSATGTLPATVTVTVTILGDGTLVVNGVTTPVDTDVTGTAGG